MCCLFFNISFYVTFHFMLTDTFQHFLKDRLGGDEFPELLLAWESVHLTSFLKDCFAGWSTLDRPFFSFSTLNISLHSLLACEISAEKSTGKIMGFPCKLQALFFWDTHLPWRESQVRGKRRYPSVLLYVFPKGTPWRRQWHPTPILLPGKSYGWRSLVGCSPWGH